MPQSLKEKFEHAIEQDSAATDLEEITARSCTSDNFDGVQYNIFGDFIPIRPIIDVVAESDGHGIEQLHHTNDGEHVCVGVFVADIPQQSHPAFVDG